MVSVIEENNTTEGRKFNKCKDEMKNKLIFQKRNSPIFNF